LAHIHSNQSTLSLDQPKVMGILNVTPDSFSDGGQYTHIDAAITRVEQMVAEGADIIDIGGESTRPGAAAVTTEEELNRVLPVVQALKGQNVWISVDTSNPDVMQAVAREGAHLLNDVRGFTRPTALEVAAETGLALCMMHMQGEPKSMQQNPQYQNVLDDVYCYLAKRIQAASEHSVPMNKLLLDPGFGFGKRLEDNLKLLSRLERFHTLGAPLLVGISRKSMIGQLLNEAPVDQRLFGSLAAAVIAAQKGAKVLRVHDVKPTVDALKVVDAVRRLSPN
jgi:dihydropteroate synthase